MLEDGFRYWDYLYLIIELVQEFDGALGITFETGIDRDRFLSAFCVRYGPHVCMSIHASEPRVTRIVRIVV